MIIAVVAVLVVAALMIAADEIRRDLKRHVDKDAAEARRKQDVIDHVNRESERRVRAAYHHEEPRIHWWN